jgi:hypothetical protein
MGPVLKTPLNPSSGNGVPLAGLFPDAAASKSKGTANTQGWSAPASAAPPTGKWAA